MILELEHIQTGMSKEVPVTLEEYRLLSGDAYNGFNEGMKSIIDRGALPDDWEKHFFFERVY